MSGAFNRIIFYPGKSQYLHIFFELSLFVQTVELVL